MLDFGVENSGFLCLSDFIVAIFPDQLFELEDELKIKQNMLHEFGPSKGWELQNNALNQNHRCPCLHLTTRGHRFQPKRSL